MKNYSLKNKNSNIIKIYYLHVINLFSNFVNEKSTLQLNFILTSCIVARFAARALYWTTTCSQIKNTTFVSACSTVVAVVSKQWVYGIHTNCQLPTRIVLFRITKLDYLLTSLVSTNSFYLFSNRISFVNGDEGMLWSYFSCEVVQIMPWKH